MPTDRSRNANSRLREDEKMHYPIHVIPFTQLPISHCGRRRDSVEQSGPHGLNHRLIEPWARGGFWHSGGQQIFGAGALSEVSSVIAVGGREGHCRRGRDQVVCAAGREGECRRLGARRAGVVDVGGRVGKRGRGYLAAGEACG